MLDVPRLMFAPSQKLVSGDPAAVAKLQIYERHTRHRHRMAVVRNLACAETHLGLELCTRGGGWGGGISGGTCGQASCRCGLPQLRTAAPLVPSLRTCYDLTGITSIMGVVTSSPAPATPSRQRLTDSDFLVFRVHRLFVRCAPVEFHVVWTELLHMYTCRMGSRLRVAG